MKPLIYLDNAATTRPAAEVVQAMDAALKEGFHNPSALYAQGVSAKKRMDEARTMIRTKLSANGLVFTSGGTEANNLAILGFMKSARARSRILYSAIEHAAVREACLSLSNEHEVLSIPVNREGVLDLEAARSLMTPETALVCVMQVNNEVGSVQPLDELARIRNERCPGAMLHVDGVQGFLRLPVSMRDGIDSYALSAHKIHGPKGMGALALSARAKPRPVVFGGGQESAFRSGTENTAGIAGLSAAVLSYPVDHQVRALKQRLYDLIRERLPSARLNGPEPGAETACDHILNLSFPPVRGQTFMHALEGLGVLVSQGSACSSRSRKPSQTLLAMGAARELTDSAIRFSLSPANTPEEIERTAAACAEAYSQLVRFTRR